MERCNEGLNHPPKEQSPRRAYVAGMLLVLLAALLWSLNGLLIKLVNAGGAGPHGVTIACYRSLFAGLFLSPLAWGRFGTLLIQGRNGERGGGGLQADQPGRSAGAFVSALRRPARPAVRPAVWAGVLVFVLMTSCFVVANTRTEAANAIILQYTSTFWVFLLSPVLLGEKPSGRDVPILVLALMGVGVIFAGESGTDLSGLVIALGAGFFYGLLTVVLRQLRDCDAGAVTVVNNLGSAVLLFPFVLVWDDPMLAPREWLLMMLMGSVQLGLPYYLFSRGLAAVPAHHAALLTMAEPVLVPIWTYLGVREKVPPSTALGGGVILLALGLFILSATRRSARARALS